MRIVVCVKQVIDTSVPAEVDPAGRALATEGLVFIPNPVDMCAAALAAKWTTQYGGESIAVTLGHTTSERALRAALAQGIDRGILVRDQDSDLRDPMEKARLLSGPLKLLAPDLVLCGTRSADTGRGIVSGALAEFLGLPQVTGVSALRLGEDQVSVIAQRRLERGMREEVLCPLPALIAVEEDIAAVAYPGLPRYVDALSHPLETGEGAPPSAWGRDRQVPEVVALGPLRPRPKKMLAPDSSLSASDRLKQLMGGAARKAQATDMVTGSPEELAAAFVRFLKQQGIL
ncbi:MAG: electron transfer flavoprotein subunit beta/FixA family protein [Chloroflexota bacterium]